MKLIAVLLIFCAVSFSAAYSKNRVKEVFKVGKQCMQELSISMEDNVIERVMYNRGPTRDDMKYMRCVYAKFNLLDASDNIVVEKMVEFMVDRYEEQVIRPVITKCAKQEDPSVYERLWKFYQCFSTDNS